MSLQTRLHLTALSTALGLAFPGWAQTAPSTDNGTAPPQAESAEVPSRAAGKLKDVVVTAERRRESAQKTSISLSAVSGDEARSKGETTLQAVVSDTPALTIQTSPQGGQIYIRGIGSSGDSNWVDPAVGIMIDGVYSGRAEAVMSGLYDVARIEVLRGPQGTLYGRNSTGGTINVISNEPSQKMAGSVQTQLGNYNLRHVDGMINLPLSDTVAARLAVIREKRDGYFSNNGYASDLTGARLKIKAKPSTDLAIGLTLDEYQQKGDGATTVPRQGTNLPPFANWATYPKDSDDPWFVDSVHPADKQDIRFTTLSGQVDYSLGFATLTVIPAHVKSKRVVASDLVAGTALQEIATSTWTETQNSLEMRLASPVRAPTRWVLGAYGFDAENRQVGRLGSALSYTVYGQTVPTRSMALFGQVQQPLASDLRGVVGARYTKDRKTQEYGIRSNIGTYDSGVVQASFEDSQFTWKLGIEKDLAATSMLYATASTGYKAGGFSTAALPPRTYDSEHLMAFEIGSKNRFFDNTLQFNASAYLYRYKNHQLQFPVFAASPNPDDAAGTTEFNLWVTNAKTATNTGVEAELKWQFTPSDQVKASLAYIDARYGDFEYESLQYLTGTRMANTAPWSGAVGYEHLFDLSDGRTVTAGLQTRFSQGYHVTPDKTMDNAFQGGYALADASATYRSADGQLSVSGWIRNIGNRAVASYAYPLGRVMIGAPRTFGVNVNYSF